MSAEPCGESFRSSVAVVLVGYGPGFVSCTEVEADSTTLGGELAVLLVLFDEADLGAKAAEGCLLGVDTPALIASGEALDTSGVVSLVGGQLHFGADGVDEVLGGGFAQLGLEDLAQVG